MSWTKEIWRQSIARALFEYANIPFQQAIWTGKLEGSMSVFDEAIERLFDAGVPEYLSNFLEQDFLSAVEAEKLKELDALISSFIKKQEMLDLTNEEIWLDLDWIGFSKKSKDLLQFSFLPDLLDSKYQEWLKRFPL